MPADVPTPRNEAEVMQAIAAEEERLQSRLAELQAAKELAATRRQATLAQPEADDAPLDATTGPSTQEEQELADEPERWLPVVPSGDALQYQHACTDPGGYARGADTYPAPDAYAAPNAYGGGGYARDAHAGGVEYEDPTSYSANYAAPAPIGRQLSASSSATAEAALLHATPEAHVAAALEAAAAVATAVPWHEPPPFQAPQPWIDPGTEHTAEEAEAIAVETAAIAAAGEEAEAAAAEAEGDEADDLLRVPATLRLISVAEAGAGQTFNASDLPSPPSSPARRLPDDLPPTPTTPPDEYEDDYANDEFETDEEEEAAAEAAEAAAAEEEAAALRRELAGEDDDPDGLEATLPMHPGGQGGFGSFAACQPAHSIETLEATLRDLQMRNDEQAVVQDEVEALSGTLRAVAEHVVMPPHVSSYTINIHRQFSDPTAASGTHQW